MGAFGIVFLLTSALQVFFAAEIGRFFEVDPIGWTDSGVD
jgi:hypothetical protein